MFLNFKITSFREAVLFLLTRVSVVHQRVQLIIKGCILFSQSLWESHLFSTCMFEGLCCEEGNARCTK